MSKKNRFIGDNEEGLAIIEAMKRGIKDRPKGDEIEDLTESDEKILDGIYAKIREEKNKPVDKLEE